MNRDSLLSLVSGGSSSTASRSPEKKRLTIAGDASRQRRRVGTLLDPNVNKASHLETKPGRRRLKMASYFQDKENIPEKFKVVPTELGSEVSSFGDSFEVEVVDAKLEQMLLVDAHRVSLPIEKHDKLLEEMSKGKHVPVEHPVVNTVYTESIISEESMPLHKFPTKNGYMGNEAQFEAESQTQAQNNGKSNETFNRKRLSKSSSLLSLTNSLSLKSLASIVRSDANTSNDADGKKAKRRFRGFSLRGNRPTGTSETTKQQLRHQGSNQSFQDSLKRVSASPSLSSLSTFGRSKPKKENPVITISNPIPDSNTRDRINDRLKRSTLQRDFKLKSLVQQPQQQSNFQYNRTAWQQDLHILHHLSAWIPEIDQLLNLSQQATPLSFVRWLNQIQMASPRMQLELINLGKNSLVFLEYAFKSDIATPKSIWKVIPLWNVLKNEDNGNEENEISQGKLQMSPSLAQEMHQIVKNENELNVRNILNEINISIELSKNSNLDSGFQNVESVKILAGSMPASLIGVIESSNKFNSQLKITQELKNNDGLYVLLKCKYAGITLENYQLEKWTTAANIIKQMIDILNKGRSIGFTHYDLTSTNILISKNEKISIIDYSLVSGPTFTGDNVKRDLYDIEFFEPSLAKMGRKMRKDPNNTEILWISELVDLLLNKDLQPLRLGPIIGSKGNHISDESKAYEKIRNLRKILDVSLEGKKSKWDLKINNISELVEYWDGL